MTRAIRLTEKEVEGKMEDVKQFTQTPNSGHSVILRSPCSTRTKRHHPKPTESRPSDIKNCPGETERGFTMLPVIIPCEQPTMVFLSFDEPVSTNEAEFQIEIQLIDTDSSYARRVDAIWVNPFTCYFMASENPPGRVTVRIYEKGRHIGSKELSYQSKQSEHSVTIAELFLRHIRLLCDELLMLGKTTDHLDRLLASVFDSDEEHTQKHLFIPYRYVNSNVTGALELPTMLHLAAKYGFSELCCRLTDLPSVYYASRLTNSSGDLPEDIAVQMGHDQLAGLLETFREVRDGLESVYVACRSSQVNNNGEDDEHYLTMHSCDQQNSSSQDYMSLFEERGNYVLFEDNQDVPSKIEVTDNDETEVIETSPVVSHCEKPDLQPATSTDEDNATKVVSSLAKTEDNELYSASQKELLALMHQVKTQVLTIAEAEVLFKEWKLRFHDKSASFKQKQAMLTKMRAELTHLQTHIKKGFFGKIVSRLKSPKMKGMDSYYQSDDSISEDKQDDVYCDITEELRYIKSSSSTGHQRETILESSSPRSSPPPPLPPHLVSRNGSPESLKSERRGIQDERCLDDDHYVISDPLSPDPYGFPPQFSPVQQLSCPSQNACQPPESTESQRKTSLSPDSKPQPPVKAKLKNLAKPSALKTEKSPEEVSENGNLMSPPIPKRPLQTKRPPKAQPPTPNSTLARISTPRKWFSSSKSNRSVEEAETETVSIPKNSVRDLNQDSKSPSSLPANSKLDGNSRLRKTSEEAKEVCGSKVKNEIGKWKIEAE